MTPAEMQTRASPTYLTLANSLETQVQANVFRPGDRLPSVRSLCGDHRLSMETVLHTLRVLEDRGIVEARPRSGFYIKFRNQLPEPFLSRSGWKRRRLKSASCGTRRSRSGVLKVSFR